MSVSTNLNTPSLAAFPAPVSPVALQGEQGGVISQQAPEPSSLAPRIDPASAGQGVEEQRARSGGNQVASADDESGQAALKKLAQDLGRLLAGSSQELKISIDPALRRAVFRIVDSKTGDIILQVPSEEAMRINKMLEQSADGGGTAGPAAGLLMQGKA